MEHDQINGVVSSSKEFGLRNMRSMTEFISCILSKYLVETWLVDFDKLRSKESAISISKTL